MQYTMARRAPAASEGTYVARGSDLVVVAAMMSARGCWGRYVPGHHYEYQVASGNVTELTVTAEPVINLPAWREYEQASAAQKAEWDRMMVALREHEAEHHRIFVEKWNRLRGRLRRLAGGRAVPQADIDNVWRRFDRDLVNAQRGYDRTSRNGQNDGVRLDPPQP